MVPPELRQEPHVSFTQLDTYLRCPLRYRLQYVDRVRAGLRPGRPRPRLRDPRRRRRCCSGGSPAARGRRVEDVQAYFASLWALETAHRPVRFGEKDSPESLLDLGTRMLAVLCAEVPDATEVVAVESAFAVPLVDQATGAVLDRDLVGTLDLVERDAEGRLVVVDLKTAARKYSDLQVEASLQLSIYSYATAMNGLADEAGPPPPLRRAHEDQAARAPPLLDHPRPRGERPALPAGRRDPRRRRCGRLPAAGRLALPGLPGAEPVLGVGVSGPARPQGGLPEDRVMSGVYPFIDAGAQTFRGVPCGKD